ncbi:DinB family protein [Niallia endozanthoxylica]|uniref:DinB family protein n=1 Tax=Niallia endozanthoxylica TaxID=2036016 RepID=A0A5J5HJ53_9BACI|nr:DinB family protein [Niallia endozanthoxylica]KAA9019524.1 DinB family protein [Niallia endozanthoxylica]
MNHAVHQRMVETRNNLIKNIKLLSYDAFNYKSEPHQWSIAQICHHLVLVEKATVKAITWGLSQSSELNTERKNVQLILDRTKKLQAPEIVEPDTAPFDVKRIIELLNESRNELITRIRLIDDPSILKTKSVYHPAFGDLSLDQWIEAVYLHEERHMEQIRVNLSLLDLC